MASLEGFIVPDEASGQPQWHVLTSVLIRTSFGDDSSKRSFKAVGAIRQFEGG
jgi:hypothetical protein